MAAIPSGTVTLLFTDIEGSTRLWEEYPQAMNTSLAQHDEILRKAIEGNGGYVFKTVGDAFCAAFTTAPHALAAALTVQHALRDAVWGETGSLKVRSALHTGACDERDNDYFGNTVNRVARLLSAGHGGQTLLSQTTYALVRDNLPEGVSLREMGEQRLKDLTRPEQVFQIVAEGLVSDFAPLSTLDTLPNNLPVQLTPFIGRESEVAQVIQTLSRPDVRLLSLIGPGGIGKTRLGLQVAAEVVDQFEDGAFYISLDAVTDAALVIGAIGLELGLREGGNQPIADILKGYLKDRQILIVLDNFEQVIKAAPEVADLLTTCPGIKVLVTSREVLHIQGEHNFSVPSLSLPDRSSGAYSKPDLATTLSQYEAVRLFIDRAVAVQPGFEVTNENAPAVAEICHRLDGLPLAIELAVARIRLLSPEKLLARLDKTLALLNRGAKDRPSRQQTLRGAIAWSYDLLDEEEKTLFRRLSVFSGGFTLEAAEEVCSLVSDLECDVLDGMASLEEKSLLNREESEGDSRYGILETIREYAKERLTDSGETEKVSRKHAEFFHALAVKAEPELDRLNRVAWKNMLNVELDNFRAALAWSLDGGNEELGLALAGMAPVFMYGTCQLSESRKWLEKAMSVGGTSSPAFANLIRIAGDHACSRGDISKGLQMLERSIALYREMNDPNGLARSLASAGLRTHWNGDLNRASAFTKESLAIFRETGDAAGIGDVLFSIGMIAVERGDLEQAQSLLEQALAIREAEGNIKAISTTHLRLGSVAMRRGDFAAAEVLMEKSLQTFRHIGEKSMTAVTLRELGAAALKQGNLRSSKELLGEAMHLYMEQAERGLNIRTGFAFCLTLFADIANKTGRIGKAVQLTARVVAIRSPIVAWGMLSQAELDESLTAMREQLGDKGFEAAWEKGQAMSVEEALKYALEDEE